MPGLRTKVGTYAAALFLLKDTFKESVQDPDMFEKEFVKFLKENNIEFDNTISEEVVGFGEILPKGNYVLVNDILNKEEEDLTVTVSEAGRSKGAETYAESWDDTSPSPNNVQQSKSLPKAQETEADMDVASPRDGASPGDGVSVDAIVDTRNSSKERQGQGTPVVAGIVAATYNGKHVMSV